MHSVRRHELGVYHARTAISLSAMHSVRRHELGVNGHVDNEFYQRCIPCGDMSWERRRTIERPASRGCIPCGDMSWECVG